MKITIDNIGFDVESVKALSLKQFKETYGPQRQYGVSEKDWDKWMVDAYGMLMGEAVNDKIKSDIASHEIKSADKKKV